MNFCPNFIYAKEKLQRSFSLEISVLEENLFAEIFFLYYILRNSSFSFRTTLIFELNKFVKILIMNGTRDYLIVL